MNAYSLNEDVPPLALLAGGLATRLGVLTERVPKSLIIVAGEPFIAHQLRLLACQGIREIVVCGGHLSEQIESFVGDGSRYECRVRYSHDGPTLLGTGGAIRHALPLLGPRFWVMYGDSYLTAPFAPLLQAFESLGRPALMTVVANRNRWDISNIEFVEGTILRYDKRSPRQDMQYIDYGLGLYTAEVFCEWPEQVAFDLSDLQNRLVEHGEMGGYEVPERFYEIGSPSGLAETDAFLTTRVLTGRALSRRCEVPA